MTLLKVLMKQLGGKKSLIWQQNIEIQWNKNSISLENLIYAIVEQQVWEYNKKVWNNADDKHINDNPELFLFNNGKYSFWNIYNKNSVDWEKAKQVAILWFKDWLYCVFYWKKEINDINEIIDLSLNEELCFIRLTFLAGSIWR